MGCGYVERRQIKKGTIVVLARQADGYEVFIKHTAVIVVWRQIQPSLPSPPRSVGRFQTGTCILALNTAVLRVGEKFVCR